MKKEGKRKLEKGRVGFCLLKGMAVALAITCIIFIGFGILLTYTEISEDRLPLVSLICTALSAAVAGYDWAGCMQKKGLLWGMAAGGTYMILLFLITGIASGQFDLELSAGMTAAVAMAGGAVGGVLGVNRK